MSSQTPRSITPTTVFYLNQPQQINPPQTLHQHYNLQTQNSLANKQAYQYRVINSPITNDETLIRINNSPKIFNIQSQDVQAQVMQKFPAQSQSPQLYSVSSNSSMSPAASQSFHSGNERECQDSANQQNEHELMLKCARFLKTLLRIKPQQQPLYNISEVKELIRKVVLGEQTPEEFTARLREVTKSQDKGNLLPFLRRALPVLRRAIQTGEELELRQALDLESFMRKSEPIMHIEETTDASNVSPIQHVTNFSATNKAELETTKTIQDTCDIKICSKQESGNLIKTEAETTTLNNSITNTDIINNLPQMLLNPQALVDKILIHMPNAEGVDPEVLSIISNAAETRLRTILAHLAVLAEHRLEPLKINPMYQAIDEPRKQLRFMEEIDKRAYENRQTAEKEALLKITKSKGKDKDTLEKAKQLQKADREEMVNREANAAAFAALGGSRIGAKRPFTSNHGIGGIQNQGLGSGLTGARPLRNIKRVTMRDLQFFLGADPMIPNNSKLRHRLALSNLSTSIDENILI